MIDSYNITPFVDSQCSDDYCSLDEPTYANESQWFIYSSGYNEKGCNISDCGKERNLSFSGSTTENSSDEKSLNDVYCQIKKDTTLKQNKLEEKAAITIQKFYRKYRLKSRAKRENYKERFRKLNQSIDRSNIYDEVNLNVSEELESEPNHSSDQGFESCSNEEIQQIEFIEDYSSEHIYDSIPCDFPSPHEEEPSIHQENAHKTQHHVDCPLSKARKFSEDLNRIEYISSANSNNNLQVETRITNHRRSDATSSHNTQFICNNQLIDKINSNLYIVRKNNEIIERPGVPFVVKTNNNNINSAKTCIHQKPIQKQIPPNHIFPQHNSSHQLVLSPMYQQPVNSQPQNLNPAQLQFYLQQQQQRKILTQSQLSPNSKLEIKKTIYAKRMYRVGLNIFNNNPEKGINYLIKHQFASPHPSYLAKFLLTKNGISRSSVGEYLGLLSNTLASQVTKYLLRRINMKKKQVDEALRSFIYYVHLPGESQKIEYLMEEFKEAYLSQNDSICGFKDPATIMVLSYAIIMLQTDAHNTNIKKADKMTVEQFVRNLRGVDQESDINPQLLEQIYQRVINKEMKTMPDHTDQVRRFNEVIVGPNKPSNFVTRSRRFMCYCRLHELPDDKKNKPEAHQREVFLFNDLLLISKLQTKSKRDDNSYVCKYVYPLIDIQVKQFNTHAVAFGIQLLKRDTNESLIKLSARCKEDQKKFCFDLNDCIYESLEMEKLTNRKDQSSSMSSLSVTIPSNDVSRQSTATTNTSNSSSSTRSSPKLNNDQHRYANSNNNVFPQQQQQYNSVTTPNPPRRQESLNNYIINSPHQQQPQNHPDPQSYYNINQQHSHPKYQNPQFRLHYHNNFSSQI